MVSQPRLGILWSGIVAIKYKHLKTTTPQILRDRFHFKENMPRCYMGWHFSSLGGYERAKAKYYDVVEGYDQFMSYEEWRKMVNGCQLVEIDHTYPEISLNKDT